MDGEVTRQLIFQFHYQRRVVDSPSLDLSLANTSSVGFAPGGFNR
ncbi:hypothetical protein BN1012_Phect2541 [Candidatus Phaeomarinobacter ectocarpi]|uniref:Uncharacterized protein n=1 Tax=Candidatus Phaeomarinibacter ectocarpi TaxID=1458461 RepID=X5MGT2_9HYPH|nr:hypothetical protein BN1012_Phect2541 [Candidatus Phaeomarinobacter ectocarpi]